MKHIQIINQSKLFSDKELQEIKALLPTVYQNLMITIHIIDAPAQIFDTTNNTFSNWLQYIKLKFIKGLYGHYATNEQQIVLITRFDETYRTFYTKKMLRGLKRQKHIKGPIVQEVKEIITEIAKPQFILLLLHEIRHAYQHLCMDKDFDVKSAYLDQWQETDADDFAQTFYNQHAKEFQRIFHLAYHYRLKLNRKQGKLTIEKEDENEKTTTIHISYQS